MGVFAGTSSWPPAFAQATTLAMVAASSAFECASGTPTSDAGHGGMYFDATTAPMPSEMRLASPAFWSCQCSPPTSPLAWQAAQLAASTGSISFLYDGPVPDFAGPARAPSCSGTFNFAASTAVMSMLRATSSEVLTSPTRLIGPTPNVDIFTVVFAEITNSSPDCRPVDFHSTGASTPLTFSLPRITKS